MKATGIVRRIDDLGRVVIPKEIRRTMRIREGDPLEIFTDKDGELIFKKYSPIGELSDFAAQICDSLRKATDGIVAVSDRDSVIAIAGGVLIARRALKPLRAMALTAAQISGGDDLKKRMPDGGSDELAQLAGAFNGMMQRLDDAFEAERQFASDASHELRTPMAVIMAQCEDALSGEKTGADYREALSVIHRQGRRMNRMISGMLELVRMERKTDRYAREPFNLSALTESVCEDMALICEKNIALTTDVEPDISITGDQTLITRLLGNLIGNAYRYGRENGHIIVTLHRAGSAIELTVSDDGIGIAPDQQKKIFRRLYQGASERSGDGAGLGLAMARQIARLHGGELTVVSEEGKGSAFTARFPMQ